MDNKFSSFLKKEVLMTKKRVVITGIGAVTPYGVGADILWNNVSNGVSAISRLEEVNDLERHSVLIGGEIKSTTYNPLDYFDAKEAKRLDKFLQFALIATKEAIQDANIKEGDVEPYRFAVIYGCAAGGYNTIEKNYPAMIDRGPTKCSPYTVPMLIVDMAAGRISMEYGAKGINKCIATACATATHCIGDAFRAIQYGEADVVITGGTDAVVCNLGIGAFSAARTLSKRNDEPTKASRPYDKDRDGFVMSEGAGTLILEELEHAKTRGAKIYAEVVGLGQTGDAYDVVAPRPDGECTIKAMEFAIKDANLEPKDIDYINTHGTSTHLGDIAESKAIATLFGETNTNPNLKISSTKSETGHLLGASGAIEAIICIKAINNSIVPPTINIENLDEEVAKLNYVPNKKIEQTINVAMSNSFGFGGHNAVLVFKKY